MHTTSASYSLNCSFINHRVIVPGHMRSLGDVFWGAGCCVEQRVFYRVAELRRELRGGESKWLYIIAHSDKIRGMHVGESITINGEKFASMLPPRKERRPEMIFFNTCHAVQSGLVEASLKAGVKTVIASDKAILIQYMCAYAEAFFRSWLVDQLLLKQALEKTNHAFADKNISFEIYGHDRIDLRKMKGKRREVEKMRR